MCFAVAPQTTQDHTVVIAVMVSVCMIILLAALILILCYRKKRTSKQIHFTFLLKVPFKSLLQVIKPMKREVSSACHKSAQRQGHIVEIELSAVKGSLKVLLHHSPAIQSAYTSFRKMDKPFKMENLLTMSLYEMFFVFIFLCSLFVKEHIISGSFREICY